MAVLITKVVSSEGIQTCLNLRSIIFVQGQGVPLDEDIDGNDNASEHYLLFINDDPVGVSRVRFVDDIAKIERVGILNDYQGRGYGKLMMNAIVSDLKQCGGATIAKLGSQVHAIPFYEKLGFVTFGEEYMDAGIPHKNMQLDIT